VWLAGFGCAELAPCVAIAMLSPPSFHVFLNSIREVTKIASEAYSSHPAAHWFGKKKISFVLERDREIERLRVFWELRFGQIA
jgi:hypothetical protein